VLLARVEACCGEEGLEAAAARFVVECRGDLCEERIEQVGDDDADEAGAPAREIAGEEIGRVAELRDDLEDARAGLGADVGLAVEDAGDGAERDVGDAGDILNADAACGRQRVFSCRGFGLRWCFQANRLRARTLPTREYQDTSVPEL
jgi:hypothetical protein